MPGNFYTFQYAGSRPPLPANFRNLPFWNLGNGVYLLDDRNVDYAALQAEADAAAALDAFESSQFSMLASSSLNSSYAYANAVYLTNLVVSSTGSQPVAVSFTIMGGTNNVPYDIFMSTNAATGLAEWTWLGIG